VQVGTSSLSPLSRGTDYAFISATALIAESPRIAPIIDLPHPRHFVVDLTATGASPRRDQSLRGHTAQLHAAEGFPRHYPSAVVSSLVETAGVGFAVMSGCSHGITPMQGKLLYPTRNFARIVPTSLWGPDHIFISIVEPR